MKLITIIAAMIIIANISYAEPIRDFTLPDINDRPVSLSDYTGDNIVIIDFWASWCAPCMRYMPELEKIHKDYDDVVVIGISIDNPRSVSRAKSLLRSQKYTMISMFDTNQELMKRFQVTSVPHTFVLGFDGELIYEHTGYTRGDEEELLKKINEYRSSYEKTPEEE